jgi:hypothetical protein
MKEMSISYQSLKAIMHRRGPEIAQNRAINEAAHDQLTRLAAEDLEDRILNGAMTRNRDTGKLQKSPVETRELAMIYGISADKALACRAYGQPQRIEVLHADARDVLKPFASLVAGLTRALDAPPSATTLPLLAQAANATEVTPDDSDPHNLITSDNIANTIDILPITSDNIEQPLVGKSSSNTDSHRSQASAKPRTRRPRRARKQA